MEEKEAKCVGSLNCNSNMGAYGSLSLQLHHCYFSGNYVRCCFTLPLGQYSQTSRQVSSSSNQLLSLFLLNWIQSQIVESLINIIRDPPEVSGLEISEQWAFEMANMIRAWMEEGIRWMFRVSAEREWYVFAGTVAGLGLLSYVGTLTDLLTLIYTGQ